MYDVCKKKMEHQPMWERELLGLGRDDQLRRNIRRMAQKVNENAYVPAYPKPNIDPLVRVARMEDRLKTRRLEAAGLNANLEVLENGLRDIEALTDGEPELPWDVYPVQDTEAQNRARENQVNVSRIKRLIKMHKTNLNQIDEACSILETMIRSHF